MINWDKNEKIKETILPIFVIVIILLNIVFLIILYKNVQKNIFAEQMVEVSEKNQEPVFAIQKLYLCSSANAIDNTEEQNLSNLNLYQYTDIAIFLNNFAENSELTNKNTIKELYIDNIDLQLDDNEGVTSLNYTNLLKIGSREELDNILKKGINNNTRIDFHIVSTNDENQNANYENPTFYADCSNPITLKYINQLDANYSIRKDDSVVFDGSILEKAGVLIENINCKVKFKINLINNCEEYYSCWLNFKIPLNDIYQGTTIKSTNVEGSKYNFFTLEKGAEI